MGLLEVPRWSGKVQFMHQIAKESIYQLIKSTQADAELDEPLALKCLSAYVLKIKRYDLVERVPSTADEVQGWGGILSCLDQIVGFAQLMDRVKDSKNENYFQLMDEARNLCETPARANTRR